VRLLIVNRQAINAVADRMKAIALAAGVPVVGAAETEPAGSSYQAWMLGELAQFAAPTLAGAEESRGLGSGSLPNLARP
jgi:zinc/manganese transport system substrate-binding protein